MPAIKTYHYAHLEDWEDISGGSYGSLCKPGLEAGKRIGRIDREADDTTAVFALLDPLPDSWVKNADFPNVWKILKHNMGGLLLEITTDPDTDDVFVADRGHIEGVLSIDKAGIPEKYLHDSRENGERQYMLSKVPLRDCLLRQEELGFSLPEVIFHQDIPLERIRVSEQQPLLEERLLLFGDFPMRGLIAHISSIPELQPWFRRYQTEGQRRGKEK